MIAELYMLKPLLPGSCERDQLHKIIDMFGTPSDEEWPEFRKYATKIGFAYRSCSKIPLENIISTAPKDAIDLLKRMLALDPTRRMTASECLAHPYLNEKSQIVNIELPIPKQAISLPLLKSREEKENKISNHQYLATTKKEMEFPQLKPVNHTDLNFRPKKSLTKLDLVFPTLTNKENVFPPSIKSNLFLPTLNMRHMPSKDKQCKSMAPLGRAPLGLHCMPDFKHYNINI